MLCYPQSQDEEQCKSIETWLQGGHSRAW